MKQSDNFLINPDEALPEVLLEQPYIHEENFTSDMWNNETEQ